MEKKKQAIGYRGGDMPKKLRQAAGKTVLATEEEIMGSIVGLTHRAVVLSNKDERVKSVVGVREVKRQRELDEILEQLQDMVKKAPETAFRYADKIAAMKLKAELDGHLKTHSEDKHLHIHGELGQMTEHQLRRELQRMQLDDESSKGASGVPVED